MLLLLPSVLASAAALNAQHRQHVESVLAGGWLHGRLQGACCNGRMQLVAVEGPQAYPRAPLALLLLLLLAGPPGCRQLLLCQAGGAGHHCHPQEQQPVEPWHCHQGLPSSSHELPCGIQAAC